MYTWLYNNADYPYSKYWVTRTESKIILLRCLPIQNNNELKVNIFRIKQNDNDFHGILSSYFIFIFQYLNKCVIKKNVPYLVESNYYIHYTFVHMCCKKYVYLFYKYLTWCIIMKIDIGVFSILHIIVLFTRNYSISNSIKTF